MPDIHALDVQKKIKSYPEFDGNVQSAQMYLCAVGAMVTIVMWFVMSSFDMTGRLQKGEFFLTTSMTEIEKVNAITEVYVTLIIYVSYFFLFAEKEILVLSFWSNKLWYEMKLVTF